MHLHVGLNVVSACQKMGISEKTFYYWFEKFCGLVDLEFQGGRRCRNIKICERCLSLICNPTS